MALSKNGQCFHELPVKLINIHTNVPCFTISSRGDIANIWIQLPQLKTDQWSVAIVIQVGAFLQDFQHRVINVLNQIKTKTKEWRLPVAPDTH